MRFEIDTTGLGPGDRIDASICRQVIGEIEDVYKYPLYLLQLRNEVANSIKKRTGKEVTIRILEEGLHILTDAEAAAYNPRAFDNGLKAARRAHRRLLHVDVSKLSADEKQRYGSNVSAQAFKLLMLRKKKPQEVAVSTRTTPVMLKK